MTATVLGPTEIQFVTFMVQHYNTTGAILSAAKAYQDYGLPVGTYNLCMSQDLVKAALAEGGIVFEREVDDWTAKSLTPQQLVVANMLLDLTDTRTNKKKLQDVNISTATYNSWLKDPVFKEYMHKRAEQLIGENQHEVDLALLDRVRSGDLKAIEYYNELTGRFVRERANSGTSNIDIQSIIINILEIIDDEVHDNATALRIGERLKGLIRRQTIAGELVNSEEAIEVPEIAVQQDLTPELQKILEAGDGYQ